MVILGVYLQKRGYLSLEIVIDALPETIAERHHNTLPINIKALQRGAEFVNHG